MIFFMLDTPFGHVRGVLKVVGRSMDVSANVIGYKPISDEDVIAILTTRPTHAKH